MGIKKESVEKRLFYFLRDISDHASFNDLKRIEASIPHDMSLYPLKLMIEGIQGIISRDFSKVCIFLSQKMSVVQKDKIIDFKKSVQSHKNIELNLAKKIKAAKEVTNDTRKIQKRLS